MNYSGKSLFRENNYTQKILKQKPVNTRSFEVKGTSSNSLPQSTSLSWISSFDKREGIKDKNFSRDLWMFMTYKAKRIVVNATRRLPIQFIISQS